MDDHALRALALQQHGLATRRQVIELGGSDPLIARRIRSGQWARARRGVMVVGAVPPTWEQQVMAACLAAGSDALACERTAGRHWGLVERSGRVELLTGEQRRLSLDNVTTHRTLILPPMDRTVLRHIPVTSVSRTLVDLSVGRDGALVGRWLDDAVRRLGLDLRELRSCIARLAGPGRPHPTTLIQALSERWDGYDPGDSALESRVLLAISRAGLPAPVQQHPVIRPDGRRAPGVHRSRLPRAPRGDRARWLGSPQHPRCVRPRPGSRQRPHPPGLERVPLHLDDGRRGDRGHGGPSDRSAP